LHVRKQLSFGYKANYVLAKKHVSVQIAVHSSELKLSRAKPGAPMHMAMPASKPFRKCATFLTSLQPAAVCVKAAVH
jgi:hypothetical protein